MFELVRGTGGTYTYETLYSFAGGPNDGANPYAGVTLDGGNLYGTTVNGGANGHGIVYEITLQAQAPLEPGRIAKSPPAHHSTRTN